MSKIAFISLDQLDFVIDKYVLTSLFSEKFRHDLFSYTDPVHMYLSAFGRIYLYYYVIDSCKEFRGIPQEYRGEFGKPQLKNYPEFTFNIAHTKNAICIGISKNKEIGVDIEETKTEYNCLEIAKEICTPQELRKLLKLHTESDRKKYFIYLWTRKEAFTKYLGTGIQTPFHTIPVESKSLYECCLSTHIFNNYCLSVCYDRDDKITTLSNISAKDLYKRLNPCQ